MYADVAIVGGGPAGLAVGIEAARRGLTTTVLERRTGAIDKACGEGLMPAGVRALERLGVRVLEPSECAPFVGIRYVQEDGTSLEGRFPDGHGLGIRRTALRGALLEAARREGVRVVEGCEARVVELGQTGVIVDDWLHAQVVVAADGLASPLRRQAGLELPWKGSRRFGMRRHFRLRPWTDHVEVHWSEGVEAYVTPVGAERVGLAFLWDESRLGPMQWLQLLSRFPVLLDRLGDAAPDSEVRGAGPLHRPVRARSADRLVLVGDAAGYVDALSGEGLTLAFAAARLLGETLPAALHAGATRRAFAHYEAGAARLFAAYERVARLLLLGSRHPRLRRATLHSMSPALFERLLAAATQLSSGEAPLTGPAPGLPPAPP